MKKAAILFMFATALYFVLRSWYSQPGNGGIPNPRAVVGPVYLYAILALIADFLGGLPIVLAAGLTIALVWQAEKQKAPATTTVKTPNTNPNAPVTNPTQVPAGNSGYNYRTGLIQSPFGGKVTRA